MGGEGRRASSRSQNPHLPHPASPSAFSHQPGRPASPELSRSRTRTESREGPALRASGGRDWTEAARVPPRAGRGGLSRPAGPAPAGVPGSSCVLSCGPPEREQKIGLAFCSPGYSSFLPDAAGNWPRSRRVGSSDHSRAQPYGWVRRPAAQPAFHQTLRGLALCSFFPVAPPCECEPPLRGARIYTIVVPRLFFFFFVYPVCWQENSRRMDPVWPRRLIETKIWPAPSPLGQALGI